MRDGVELLGAADDRLGPESFIRLPHQKLWFTLFEVQSLTRRPVDELKKAIHSGQIPALYEKGRYLIGRDDVFKLIGESRDWIVSVKL
jgi:hypothetical protein